MQSGKRELLVEKRKLTRLANAVRWLTRIAAGLLAGAFAWLKLSGLSLPLVTGEVAAGFILRGTLVGYYFSWIAAVMIDTRDEEDVLYSAPNRGRIPIIGLTILVAASIGFGILCWVSSYHDFVLALGAFWLVNVLGWRYLVGFVTPAVEESRHAAAEFGDPFEVIKVESLETFLCGTWQWWRYIAGGASIGLLYWFSSGSGIDSFSQTVGSLSVSGLMSLAIALHVLAMETWIWVPRIRRRVEIRLLERLSETFSPS